MRYRLRSLLLGIFLVGAMLGWLVNSPASKRHRAIVRLQRPGVGMWFEHQGAGTGTYIDNAKPPGTALMRRLCGEYCQTRVIQLEVVPPGKFTDDDAEAIAIFQELDWLAINDSEITDRGLK